MNNMQDIKYWFWIPETETLDDALGAVEICGGLYSNKAKCKKDTARMCKERGATTYHFVVVSVGNARRVRK